MWKNIETAPLPAAKVTLREINSSLNKNNYLRGGNCDKRYAQATLISKQLRETYFLRKISHYNVHGFAQGKRF